MKYSDSLGVPANLDSTAVRVCEVEHSELSGFGQQFTNDVRFGFDRLAVQGQNLTLRWKTEAEVKPCRELYVLFDRIKRDEKASWISQEHSIAVGAFLAKAEIALIERLSGSDVGGGEMNVIYGHR